MAQEPSDTSASNDIVTDPNAWGVAGFVLGLVGTLLGLMVLTFPLAFVAGVAAFVFGMIGLRKPQRRAMTRWAVGLGCTAVVSSLAGAYLMLQAVGWLGDQIDDAIDDVEDISEDFNQELDDTVDEAIDRIVVELENLKVADESVEKLADAIDRRVNARR